MIGILKNIFKNKKDNDITDNPFVIKASPEILELQRKCKLRAFNEEFSKQDYLKIEKIEIFHPPWQNRGLCARPCVRRGNHDTEAQIHSNIASRPTEEERKTGSAMLHHLTPQRSRFHPSNQLNH